VSELVAAGVSHKTAPVELRERLAAAPEEVMRALPALRAEIGLQEVMLVSTCNRVEIYGVSAEGLRAGERALGMLAAARGIDPASLTGHTFIRAGREAASHICRVAASLESMVVGEPQILGQVKDAYDLARGQGTIGAILDRCLTTAFRAAKRVRTETAIARGAASVPSVAVELARSIFGELRECAALLVGAGEMAQQAGVHLKAAGVARLTVVNRGEARGQALATELGAHCAGWDDLAEQLLRADIVITSTGSPQPVITRALLKQVMKGRRGAPIFLVDIAVPRDVDPEVTKLDQVFLYNIDDLQGIVDDNLRSRASEAERADALVDQEVAELISWQRSRAVGPVIQRLHQQARQIAATELERARGRLRDLSPEQQKAVEALAHGIVQKLLHRPITALRGAAGSGDEGPAVLGLADAACALFQLDLEETRAVVEEEPVAAPLPTTRPIR
jgi:glutamyl-tRNA reductase